MRPTVVFQTDFGSGGGGVLAGVVKSVCPKTPVYDFDHAIEPMNVRQAAYQLSTVVPWWPEGTIFVSVVDPGVGSSRRSCVALLDSGCFVVTPDNGTLTMVADHLTCVREIDEARNRLPGTENVHIFHGRDVYAYTAARLAAGLITFEEVGPAYPVSEVVRVQLTDVEARVGEGWAEGGIYNVDLPYGAARVNVRNCDLQRRAGFAYGDHFFVRVTDGERVVYEGRGIYARTFADADDSEAFLCGDIQPGEGQLLRFSVRGDFVRACAPELVGDQTRAVGYAVRIERAE